MERIKVYVPIWTYSLSAGIRLTLKSTSPPLCCYGKKHIWWKIIQNIWMKFMVFILTGKPAFLILQECVCLLYAAVPSGELLEASENWVVSPSQITSRFVTVSRLWLAISDPHSVLMMSLCSRSEAAQTHACGMPGVNNFKIWPQCSGLVLFRFKRHVENGKSTYGE